MKKRYLILAGLLVMTVAAAGCGKKQTTETEPVQATATPTPEVTKAVDMVDMQQTSDDDIKNVMGEKTATASKVVFVNNTGDDIQALYIRTHVSDEDSSDEDEEDDGWGEDLINDMFTLKDKDKALYYMPSDTQTTANKSTASYDIRITYTDEEKNECFFRDIPLDVLQERVKLLSEQLHITYENEGETVTISVSMGIALTEKGKVTFQELYKRADKGLYEVKRTKKGTWHIV